MTPANPKRFKCAQSTEAMPSHATCGIASARSVTEDLKNNAIPAAFMLCMHLPYSDGACGFASLVDACELMMTRRARVAFALVRA